MIRFTSVVLASLLASTSTITVAWADSRPTLLAQAQPGATAQPVPAAPAPGAAPPPAVQNQDSDRDRRRQERGERRDEREQRRHGRAGSPPTDASAPPPPATTPQPSTAQTAPMPAPTPNPAAPATTTARPTSPTPSTTTAQQPQTSPAPTTSPTSPSSGTVASPAQTEPTDRDRRRPDRREQRRHESAGTPATPPAQSGTAQSPTPAPTPAPSATAKPADAPTPPAAAQTAPATGTTAPSTTTQKAPGAPASTTTAQPTSPTPPTTTAQPSTAPATGTTTPSTTTSTQRAPDAPASNRGSTQPSATAATAPTAAPPSDPQARRLDDILRQRTQTRDGNRLVIREPGRVIIREGNRTVIRHDETERLRGFGRDIREERRTGEIVQTIVRPDGTRIVTVLDERDRRLLRRSRIEQGGREVLIIDNSTPPFRAGPGRVAGLAPGYVAPVVQLPPPRISIPRERYIVEAEDASPEIIEEALTAPPVETVARPYKLDEIRTSVQVRDRMRRVDVDTITFDTGSWEVASDQAAKLEPIARAMKRAIERNGQEVFLVEGHTDAVGSDVDNLSLSDRRAESVAQVLTERFEVPPENLTTQGYGEQFLKVKTQAAERENRRVALRRITPLLQGTAQAGR